MVWIFLLWSANKPAWSAPSLRFAWPAGSALTVTETISSTTTNMDEVGPEIKREAGTLRVRLVRDSSIPRVRYLAVKQGVEKTILDLIVSPDGRTAVADTSALAAVATEAMAASSGHDPALSAFMAESLRRDLALAASEMAEAWVRNVGLWVGHPIAKGATKAANWGRSVATIRGLATVAIQGAVVSEARVPCTATERAKRCVRLVATGQAEPMALASLVAESPEVLRYWVGPVPPGRGNAYPDEIKSSLSEVITVVTRPESLLPISVETTVTVGVILNRTADPEYRRTVVTTSRLDFTELGVVVEETP